MLNRRLIRIRAMQALYAYEQARGANFLMAQDLISDTFAPDLNSMEKQDRNKLEGQAKLGKMLLEEHLIQRKELNPEESPKDVYLETRKCVEFYKQKNKKDFENYHLRALNDAEKVFDIYLQILQLFIELGTAAGKDNSKELPNSLAKLKILHKLAHSREFENQVLRKGISFTNESIFVNKLYREGIKENEKYLEFRSKTNASSEEELALIKYLIKNVILKHEVSNHYFDNQHIYWTEDKETLRAMVTHTFQSILDKPEAQIEKSDDEWLDKREFLSKLIKTSIEEENELDDLLLPKLKNWEMDRIAVTDRILLKMAIVEMREFTSIPVKVTINEIIEIAKEYSTPKSGQFINGVLDVLSKDLIKNGIVKKSGRGMLDNK